MTQQNLQPITRELIGALRQTGAQVQENEPMSLHTSFQIGGPADVFATVSDERSLRGVLKLCKEAGAPVYVIGNGSDLLIPDQGLRGVVVSFGGDLCRLRLENETTIVCGPGATLAKLCKFALENSLTGLEFAWGIPGSAGGAAYMNAGAYGGEMKDVLIKCRHLDENGNSGGKRSGFLLPAQRLYRSKAGDHGSDLSAGERGLQCDQGSDGGLSRT